MGQFLLLIQLSITMQQCNAVESIRRGEQVLVPDFKARVVDGNGDVLIAELDLLHLGRRSTVTTVGNAVSAEIIVGRTLTEVAAVGLEPLAVAVFFPDGLVDVIPDKAALIAAVLLIGKFRILVQSTVGVAHSMRIFALDIRPLIALCQILFNVLDRAVHMALDIGGFEEAGIIDHTFVMHQTGVIKAADHLCHLEQGLTAKRFVAQRPDQNSRMIFVTMVSEIHAVKQDSFPLRLIIGQNALDAANARLMDVPCAMGFQIVLCDQIQTILVAQVVQCILILVMAGTDGIDVVLLHGDDVPKQFLMGVYAHSTTRNGAELMTVGTLEHDALAVEQHPIVLQLELAETDFLPGHLYQMACIVQQLDFQFIQSRVLCTPQVGVLHCMAEQRRTAVQCDFFGEHFQLTAAQGQTGCALTLHLQCNFQRGMSKIIPGKQRFDGYIFQMHGGDGVQPHAAEDAGEAEEVLIFAPAGGSPLEHLHSKFVHARLEIGSQIECVCGEAVLGVTHIRPVQPKSHAAFHTLELDVDGLALHGFRQLEVFYIACHRIEPLRDLARLYFFTAIPRILNIRVLGNVVALHLDVCRNMNVIPAAAIVIRLFKAGDGTGVVLCVGEFPDTVQLQRQRRGACPIFFAGSVSTETCMSIQHVFLEKGGVFYFCKIKCSHSISSFTFYNFIIFLQPPRRNRWIPPGNSR